jgi:hypothetical protein
MLNITIRRPSVDARGFLEMRTSGDSAEAVASLTHVSALKSGRRHVILARHKPKNETVAKARAFAQRFTDEPMTLWVT